MPLYKGDPGDPAIPKTCPLTGNQVTGQNNFHTCYMADCSDVREDNWKLLYGRKYHCSLEKSFIEECHETDIKRAAKYKKIGNSLECVRSINLKEFLDYCEILDKEMVENRQDYAPEMLINPYRDPEDKNLVYLFEDDAVAEIAITDNIFSHLGRRFERLSKADVKVAINCCSVPGYMADAVNVNLNLKYGHDVKNILHADNPVYIKARDMGKYIDAAYGWTWLDFQKVRAQCLEMQEIPNFDNVVYIKQQLDEIIRRDYGHKLKV